MINYLSMTRDQLTIRIVRKLLRTHILKFVLNQLPQEIQGRVQKWDKNKGTIAAYYQDKHYKFIDEEEFKKKSREALLFLSNKYGISELGEYLEFGVCQGTSLLCMYQLLKELDIGHVRLFGFDSFEGLPADQENIWKLGQFQMDYKAVRKYLTWKGINWNRVVLEKGWFSDTLTGDFINQNKIKKASIILIDCDIYSSTKEALNFCASLIKDETIVFFDDWNAQGLADKNMGEKRAFDEFLFQNPNLTAKKFGSYSCYGRPNGEIFLLSRNK